jgi:hypothetical protein
MAGQGGEFAEIGRDIDAPSSGQHNVARGHQQLATRASAALDHIGGADWERFDRRLEAHPERIRSSATNCAPSGGCIVSRSRSRSISFKAHPHMLRHACGYALANRGHETRALQAYIQHAVRYTELSPTRFKDFWRE